MKQIKLREGSGCAGKCPSTPCAAQSLVSSVLRKERPRQSLDLASPAILECRGFGSMRKRTWNTDFLNYYLDLALGKKIPSPAWLLENVKMAGEVLRETKTVGLMGKVPYHRWPCCRKSQPVLDTVITWGLGKGSFCPRSLETKFLVWFYRELLCELL